MNKIFMITEPTSNTPYIFMSIVLFIIILLLILFVLMMIWFASISLSMKNVFFIVNDRGLQIKGFFMYSKTIDKSLIIKDKTKILNLNKVDEYKLKLKTNGMSVPGYHAGMFKLHNREKAFVYITDPTKVVYIPTKGKFSIMLSVSETEEFVKMIKEM